MFRAYITKTIHSKSGWDSYTDYEYFNIEAPTKDELQEKIRNLSEDSHYGDFGICLRSSDFTVDRVVEVLQSEVLQDVKL